MVIAATVTVNVAVVAPGATVTEAGTLTGALFLERDMSAPAPEAACVMVTVHVDVLPEFTLAGLHDTLLRLAARITEMLPAVPVSETPVPSGAAAETFVTATFSVPVAPLARVTLTIATVPFAMAFWLSPDTKHVEEPLLLEQLSDLDAAVAAGPTVTLRLAMLAEP